MRKSPIGPGRLFLFDGKQLKSAPWAPLGLWLEAPRAVWLKVPQVVLMGQVYALALPDILVFQEALGVLFQVFFEV